MCEAKAAMEHWRVRQAQPPTCARGRGSDDTTGQGTPYQVHSQIQPCLLAL